jgi:sensor histidine kinase YesM
MSFNTTTVKWFDDSWILILGIPLMGLVFPVISGLINHDSLQYIIVNSAASLVGTAMLWLGCRALLHRVMEAFPWQHKALQHLVIELIAIPAYTFLVIVLMWMIAQNIEFVYSCLTAGFWEHFLVSMGISLIISFIHEGLYFFFQWKATLLQTQKLENENMISKYETLKSQINPHFLFNSFNTLITIIDEDKEAAIEYVEHLSDFFRILLQLRDQMTISVEEELMLVETYFFLQTKRYGTNIQLETHVNQDHLKMNLPPLSLQMLIENAIKHNVISTEHPLKIEIKSLPDNVLQIQNNLRKRTDPASSGGIGLDNIRKRYALLSGVVPEISETSNTFTVQIPLLVKA